jgi:hypothetical protein
VKAIKETSINLTLSHISTTFTPKEVKALGER